MSRLPLPSLRIGLFETRWLVVFLVLALSTGCFTVGPKTIPRDRVEYAEALRDSWKRQVLLNIVSLRYADAPSFLEVVSVINQYSLEGNASAGVIWGGLTAGQNLGAGARWSDRPTVTYAPVTGERYVRSMLTPVPPASVIALVQAGFPVDFVLGLTTRSINGIAAPGRSRFMGQSQRNEKFAELVEVFRRIQSTGAIGLRTDADHSVALTFGDPIDDASAEDLRIIRTILGLDQGQREFALVFGPTAADGSEMALLTRSMLDIMIELSAGVDVPPEDVAAGRTDPSPEMTTPQFMPHVRIHSSEDEPESPFVSVRYRERWFWVDDGDVPSKRTLSFLLILLSLTESGGGQGAPLVTVGAGW